MILNDYNETYAHRMRDKNYLEAYLEACLAEGPEAFYVGLRRAIQARAGGFTGLAAQTGLGRESLYRALSAEGNPSFRTILKILHALGADVSLPANIPADAESVEGRKNHRARSAKAAKSTPKTLPAHV